VVRAKRTKNIVAGIAAYEHAEKKKVSGWDRSKFTPMDHRKLMKLGLLTDDGKMKIPGDEATPICPKDIGYFFLISSFAGSPCLFMSSFGTPFSLRDSAVPIGECFLGIHPHWGLWKHIFYL
jgi:hypothetical protein